MSENQEKICEKIITVEYVCANCQGTKWDLKLIYIGGATMLRIMCGNEQCTKNRLEEIKLETGESVTEGDLAYGIFDITGQGFDEEDLQEQLEDVEEVKVLN